MKLRHTHTRTNNTTYQDTNSTPPLRHTFKPPIPRPTRRKQPTKRPRRQTEHINTQLYIKQCKGWTLPGPSPSATTTTHTTKDTPKPKVAPSPTPHTHLNNPTSLPPPRNELEPITKHEYSHPPITALTFKTREMHTTILDLQNILATQ